MASTIYDFLCIVGAVGLFIFGMKLMSEAIQRFAGKAMRRFVNNLISSPIAGVFTGFFTTSLIQSSSAATVMIVSFSHAGIFKLRQAISLIMGANIGTTITAWLFLVFGFSKIGVMAYVWPLLAIAAPLIFVKKQLLKNWGHVIFGFSIMFIGLGQLRVFFEDLELQNDPNFLLFINNLSEMRFISILMFVGVGTLLAVIVQSSTVAMGFTLAFCSSGLPLELGMALVIGENLGTTSTAMIAAIVANVHGKRAARAHSLFNLISVIWFLVLFSPMTFIVDMVIHHFTGQSPLDQPSPDTLAAALAFTHSFVNVINTLLTLPFIRQFEKLIIRITPPASNKDTEYTLSYMEQGITSTSVLYVLEAKKQIAHFTLLIQRLCEQIKQYINHPDPDSNVVFDNLSQYQVTISKVQEDVSDYLTNINAHDLTNSLTERIKLSLKMVNELEKSATKFIEISYLLKDKNKEKVWFDPEQRQQLKAIFDILDQCIGEVYHNMKLFIEEKPCTYNASIYQNFDTTTHRYRMDFIEQYESQKWPIRNGVYFLEIIQLCKRAAISLQMVQEQLHKLSK
jgi:phosphate:Na+ symporter